MKRLYSYYITHHHFCQGRRRLTRFLALFLLFFASVIGISSTVFSRDSYASANDFYFTDATFDYYLTKTETGSKMHVKEVLTAVFPNTNQNHGITRSIPYTNQNGKNLTAPSKSDLNFTVLRNGESEPIAKTETESGNYIFYIGSKNRYVHGEQVYTLEYDFTNVITEFDNSGQLTFGGNNATFQELYWDTNGTGWSQKFKKLTANLHLSPELAKNLITGTSCYVGKYGASGRNAQSRCTISTDDQTTYNASAVNASGGKTAETIITFTTYDLAAYENLTFAVDFNPGTFAVPEPVKSMALVYIVAGFGAVMLLILIFAIVRYRQRVAEKWHYKKTLFLAPQYSQPKGLTVADTEYVWLSGKKNSFVATLIELAVTHKIELVKEEKEGLIGSKNVWQVKVLSLKGLTKAQENVLSIIHGGENYKEGDTFKIEKHTATSHLQTLSRNYRTETAKRLEAEGMMISHKEKKKLYSSAYSILAVFTMIFYFFAAVIVFAEYGDDMLVGGMPLLGLSAIAMFIMTVIIISIGVHAMKIHQHTHKGIDASNEIDGLREYIRMAEADRLKFLQSVKGADTSTKGIVKLYEKLLPYAIIFGEEDSWMSELNRYYEENPKIDHGWYSGSDIITLSAFHNMMSYTTNSIRSTTSYTSSSSSSSGFSGGGGGGFSGGGGGGGGGGGW